MIDEKVLIKQLEEQVRLLKHSYISHVVGGINIAIGIVQDLAKESVTSENDRSTSKWN